MPSAVLALWSGRLVSVSHLLCMARALVFLIDLRAMLWPRFWLSFFAVGGILYTGLWRMQGGTALQPSMVANYQQHV